MARSCKPKIFPACWCNVVAVGSWHSWLFWFFQVFPGFIFLIFLISCYFRYFKLRPKPDHNIHHTWKLLEKVKKNKNQLSSVKASLTSCQMLVPGRCSESSECKTRLLMSRYQVFHFLQPAEEQHNKFSKPDISSEENCFYSYLSIRPKQFLCPVNDMVDVGLNLK